MDSQDPVEPLPSEMTREHSMTDQELIDGDLKGTLTQEQYVEYLVRIEKFLLSTAHMIVYTDWDAVERNRLTGEGPIP